MRQLPQYVQDILDSGAVTLTPCVRIDRTDGVSLGFTGHDRDLLIGGLLYEALSSVDASALRQASGSGVDNLETSGLLSSDRVTEADLLAGRYDEAKVRVFLVDWRYPEAAQVTLLRGTVGNVVVRDGQYAAEVRSLTQRLNQQVGDLTTKACRVRDFGDARCSPPGGLASYQATGDVSAVTSRRQVTVGGDPGAEASGYYSYGKAEFLSGANAGLVREVKAHTAAGGAATLVLQEPLPFDPAPGDQVRLTAGCDRTFDTCRAKFGNAANYRGEPHVPGTDVLVQRGRGDG